MPCDTLVSVGAASKDEATIFGKNSDRPENEVQVVSFFPRQEHAKGTKLKCTHIEIPQVPETHAVLLSQPYWMWGAEMGANEHGVVIGNEAVWTNETLRPTGLLGMDLLRLGLERGKTARETLDVVVGLLALNGQGGPCAVDGSMAYHNSFILADSREAWILETADEWWVAERVIDAVRNISNGLSINGPGDLQKKGLFSYAIEQGRCKDESDFSFARCFSSGGFSHEPSPYSREGRCRHLLRSHRGEMTPQTMMEFLRDHEGGVCMHGGFLSAGSQVSLLKGNASKDLSLHWFTIAAPPCSSPYLPFTFDENLRGLLSGGAPALQDTNWPWIRHRRWLNRSDQSTRERTVNQLLEEERKSVGRIIQNSSKEGCIKKENEKMWENFRRAVLS